MDKLYEHLKRIAAIIAAIGIIFGSVWVFAENKGSEIWAGKETVAKIEQTTNTNSKEITSIVAEFNGHAVRNDIHVTKREFVSRDEWELRKEAVQHDIELIRQSQEKFYKEQREVNREQRVLMNEVLRRLPE